MIANRAQMRKTATIGHPIRSDQIDSHRGTMTSALNTISPSQMRRILRKCITAWVVWMLLCGAGFAQGTVPPIGKGCYYDSSGDPLSGGTLGFENAGTSTASVIYSDSTLSTPATNPTPLNASGCTTTAIFLAASTYKITLKNSAGTQIWQVDNVPSYAHFGNVDLSGTAGESLTIRDVVYLGSGAQWFKADADSAGSSTDATVIGIAVATAASGAAVTVRVQGRMTGLSALVAGSAYYISGTAGAMTSTAPTRDRVLGIADSATSIILIGGQPLSIGTIISGTYDPSLSAGSNFDSFGSAVCMYSRIGIIVEVTCQATADATAASLATTEISLPVASNFAATSDAVGIGVAGALTDAISVAASIANNTVVFSWTASVTTSQTVRFTFTYKIL
jgi:hypothetical protein